MRRLPAIALPAREIIAAVGEAVSPRHSTLDTEALPSGGAPLGSPHPKGSIPSR
jgi:hypothetical protein